MGLLDRFRPVLSIGAESGELVFRRGNAELRDPPVIRFAPDGKIIDLGARADKVAGGRLVQLLTESASDETDALRQFCKYYIMMTEGDSISLRPRVILLEPELRRVFGRNAATQLQRALVADGLVVELATVA